MLGILLHTGDPERNKEEREREGERDSYPLQMNIQKTIYPETLMLKVAWSNDKAQKQDGQTDRG